MKLKRDGSVTFDSITIPGKTAEQARADQSCTTSPLAAEIDRLREELRLNAAMLARQCDLARAAETELAAVKQDAERWRLARTILSVEQINEAARKRQAYPSISEEENKSADQAIDAAKEKP